MKIFKYILMGLGGLFLLGLLGIGYAIVDGQAAKAENKKFVCTFLTDFSSRWQLTSVEDRLTDQNLKQLRSIQGAGALANLSQLGALKTIESFRMASHRVTNSITVSTYEFEGRFENGDLRGRIQIHVNDAGRRVSGLALNIEKLRNPKVSL